MLKWQRIKYQPCLPLGKDGRLVTSSKEHIELSRSAATEGMVLLKNENNTLPIKQGTRIALFGIGQHDYIPGGGGSGEVVCRYIKNVYHGLKEKEDESKISIFHELSNFYAQSLLEQKINNPDKNLKGWYKEPELPEELIKRAVGYTDTAVICIRRFSGEDWDRSSEKGDFYLSDGETKLVETVKKNFKNIIAVLDVGGMVDSEWFKDVKEIGAALLAWQAGMEGGGAIADILCGDVNPSGKLSDTFAKKFEYYPSSEHYNDSDDYVDYNEDIYVGYRYFETVPEAKKRVSYPFGYGLSYTTFDIALSEVSEQGEYIVAKCSVRNTGDVAGKEVVQAYFSAPQGKLGKPEKQLCAFKKTKLLLPGETEHLMLKWKIDSMASYDDTGKVQMSAYLLEKGKYSFFIGNSVRNCVKAEFEYNQKALKITEQLTQQCAPYNIKRRMKSDGEYDYLPSYKKEEHTADLKENTAAAPQEKKDIYAVIKGEITLDEFMAQLSVEDLIELCSGQPIVGICNTGCFAGRYEYGIPSIGTVDGPAGVRSGWQDAHPGVYTTQWPCATLMACTWNEDLIYEVARAGGMEVKENNAGVWLTPGMNIHRSPLCGRNFEYFSEDPLLTGKCASAVIRGIQSVRVAATPKHFCCNNKEKNRRESDSRVSERALREIYLKGFEIAVKEADPWVIMTSYNKMNGVRTSENYELITNILRGEWGFKGIVTTDWWNTAEHYKEIKAGNDIKMADGHQKKVLEAYNEGKISKAEIEACAKRVIEFALKLE